MFKLISLADPKFKIKHSVIVVSALSLTILVTSFFFYSRFKFLKDRNSFLEQRYVESLAQSQTGVKTDSASSSSKPANSSEKILSVREENLLHTIYLNPDDYGVDIATYDLANNKTLLTEHADNPYFRLLQKLVSFDINKLMLKTVGETQYAVFETVYGYDASQIFVASMGEDNIFKIDSFEISTNNEKKMAYCANNFLNYYPQTQQILLHEGCGDGCGGGGELNLLSKSGSSQKLASYGAGCGMVQEGGPFLPVYLTYLDGKLYFAEYVPADDPKNEDLLWMDAVINKIYSIDPVSRSKQYLDIDLKTQNLKTTWEEGLALGETELLLVKSTNFNDKYALDVKTLKIRPYTGAVN